MEKPTLEQLTALVLEQAKTKGFGTNLEEINVAEKITLIHTEISEAYEAYRHKNMRGSNGFEEKMSDALQRMLHLCGVLGVDVGEAMLEKLRYNKGKEWNWDKLNERHS